MYKYSHYQEVFGRKLTGCPENTQKSVSISHTGTHRDINNKASKMLSRQPLHHTLPDYTFLSILIFSRTEGDKVLHYNLHIYSL